MKVMKENAVKKLLLGAAALFWIQFAWAQAPLPGPDDPFFAQFRTVHARLKAEGHIRDLGLVPPNPAESARLAALKADADARIAAMPR